MPTPAETEDLMREGLDRVSDVARFLKLSVSTVYDLMGQGQLPFIKIGTARRVPHRAVIAFAAGLVGQGCASS